MRHIAWPLLVISGVLTLAGASPAEVRPHYGGNLRVALRAAPASLDPASLGIAQGQHIFPLIFQGLTRFDAQARLQPQLATRWEADSRGQRWQFWMRSGVTFQDGAGLTADAAAASLRAANPAWTVSTAADSVVIETPAPDPELPAELALPRNGIARRANGKLAGTGPFLVSGWEPGQRLVLAAYDHCWSGRPFLDSVTITLGQNWHQRMLALELGKADVAEIAPEQARRAGLAQWRVAQSAPNELLALVFARAAQSPAEERMRQALSAAIDRGSIVTVLLQAEGEPAETILPDWMTGYAMLFAPPGQEHAVAAASGGATLTLSYDAGDPASQLIAERVALNARDAGITLKTRASAAGSEARLLRIPLISPQPQAALAEVAEATGLPAPQFQGGSEEALYQREAEMLRSGRIIPLAHLPAVCALAPGVNGWRGSRLGVYPLADVWLSGGAP